MGLQEVILRVAQHVFGTDGGYRTLAASPELTASETRELESFSFGQTSDGQYLASLATNPAFCSRVLSSGRRAVTRALCGPRDDQGRPTLLFVSYVFDAQLWQPGIDFHDGPLQSMRSLWSWNGSTAPPAREIVLPGVALGVCSAEQRQRVLSVIAALEEMSRAGDGTIVAPEGSLSADDVRVVAALLPAPIRARFSFAMRSLSDGLPVHLNCLAVAGSRGKSLRRATVWTGAGALPQQGYAAALALFWKDGATPPQEFANNCRSYEDARLKFERAVSAAAVARPQGRTVRRARTGPSLAWYWVLAIVLMALLATTAMLVQRKLASSDRVAALLEEAATFLKRNAVEELTDAEACSAGAYLDEGRRLLRRVEEHAGEGRPGQFDEVRAQLEQAVASASARCARIVAIKETLAAFGAFAGQWGIKSAVDINVCPDEAVLKDVESWRARLTSERDAARADGLEGVEQFDEAIERIDEWRKAVDKFKLTIEFRLGELEEYFGATPPKQLSAALLEEVESRRQELAKVKAEAAGGTLSQRVRECEENAERWTRTVGDLRAQHDKLIEQAEADTQEITYLQEKDIRRACDSLEERTSWVQQAREIWPDSSECERVRKELASARETLANRVYDLFCTKIERLREQIPGRTFEEPDLRLFQTELEEAMDEFRKWPDALECADPDRINSCKEKAKLLGELVETKLKALQSTPADNTAGEAGSTPDTSAGH